MGSPQSRYWYIQFLDKGPLSGLQTTTFLQCPHREKVVVSLTLLIRTHPPPLHRVELCLWPHLNLTTAQRSHLQVWPHWGLGFQHMYLRRHKHLVYNHRNLILCIKLSMSLSTLLYISTQSGCKGSISETSISYLTKEKWKEHNVSFPVLFNNGFF